MGRLIIQKIYTCDLCGKTPEDGEKLWHMNSEVWCEKCCEKSESENELLQSLINDLKEVKSLKEIEKLEEEKDNLNWLNIDDELKDLWYEALGDAKKENY